MDSITHVLSAVIVTERSDSSSAEGAVYADGASGAILFARCCDIDGTLGWIDPALTRAITA